LTIQEHLLSRVKAFKAVWAGITFVLIAIFAKEIGLAFQRTKREEEISSQRFSGN